MAETLDNVAVTEAPPTGMITIRADLGASGSAISKAVDVALPDPLALTRSGDRALAWMSPDELLLLTPPEDVAGMVDALEKALENDHHLVADVTDARVRVTLKGAGWREVLAKGSPVDLSPRAFPAGVIRRTRLGQIAVAIWSEKDDSADVLAFRSQSAFLVEWLTNAARPGALPGHF